MRWRQVTTQERPWKMKRCSSRNTSRGRKGSSETGLKLGTVSTRVRPGLNYLGAKQWLRAVSVLCPTSPRVFQASSLALVSSSKKDSELPQGSLPPGPPTGSGEHPGRAAGKLNPVLGEVGDSVGVSQTPFSALRCRD